MSLSSLSSGDFSCLPQLIQALMDRYREKRVGVSLPSMRIDNIVKQSLEETQQVKKSGLTLAPEAGTQRLRDVINKGVTEDDLIRSVTDAFECGWSSVKLYFMMGLPTETDEDLRGIGDLAKKVVDAYYRVPKEMRSKNGVRVTASASVFVPKPFTPFQWAVMDTPDDFIRKAGLTKHYIHEQLNQKVIRYIWHEADVSMHEGVLARGDRRLSKVILSAYKKGCIYDAWSEFYKHDAWLESFKECGVDPDFYMYRERKEDELFPWDFIDCHVSKDFLKREWNNAMNAKVTPNCKMGCSGCGSAKIGSGVCHNAR
jgi:radical SAM superfamily enzyme YgiQ (UPF0313 family)